MTGRLSSRKVRFRNVRNGTTCRRGRCSLMAVRPTRRLPLVFRWIESHSWFRSVLTRKHLSRRGPVSANGGSAIPHPGIPVRGMVGDFNVVGRFASRCRSEDMLRVRLLSSFISHQAMARPGLNPWRAFFIFYPPHHLFIQPIRIIWYTEFT